MSSPNLYQRLSERVGVSDNLMVMNVIVNKAMSNLKVWSRHEEIVDKSLLLFHELASGYSSSKTLSKLEVVTYTLRNHGPQQLPFLNESGNPRHRTTFYTTLTRILLMDDQGHMEFEHFMAPFAPVLQHLQAFLSNPANAGPGPARDEARGLLMGVLRDLRGVCIGTPNRRAYVAFFDWLYPDYLPMLVRAAEIWWNDSAVTTPLLKVGQVPAILPAVCLWLRTTHRACCLSCVVSLACQRCAWPWPVRVWRKHVYVCACAACDCVSAHMRVLRSCASPSARSMLRGRCGLPARLTRSPGRYSPRRFAVRSLWQSSCITSANV